MQLWRRLGRRLELAIDLYSLAWIARLRGELTRAETYLEESHAIFRELEDVRGQAGTLAGLVQVALDRGDLGRARSMLVTATELYASIRFVAGLLDLLELYAMVFERQEEPEPAAALWGRATRWAGRSAARPTIHSNSLRTTRRLLGYDSPSATRRSNGRGKSVRR